MPKLSRRQAIVGAGAAGVAAVLPAVAVAEKSVVGIPTSRLVVWSFPDPNDVFTSEFGAWQYLTPPAPSGYVACCDKQDGRWYWMKVE
ncbi:hypothetical protein LCGC14_3163260 [marine sediment metagenome]|uniref:Uncharacterized protein n=1 Tax=marine sediment metagenome TaxID=412755 RepID=A0A0F8YF07_9ZZZZ